MPRKRLVRQLFLSFLAIIAVCLLASSWFAASELSEAVRVARRNDNPADIDEQLSRLRGQVLGAAAGIAVVAAIGAWFLARRISRPIEEITAGAQQLAQGQTGERFAIHDANELAVLADSLNQLARQLEERGQTIGRKGNEQEAVLASMAEGVLAVDSDERVISLNRAAAHLIGGKPFDMRGRRLAEVVRNADLRRFAHRALESDEPIEDEMILHGEREKILHLRGAALRDGGSHSIGAVIVFSDVTDYHRLERVRRDFVANVSHELKTPIASIKGFVETLLDGAIEHRDDALRFLKIIATQSERLESIIEDLLSLSKIERAEEAGDLPLASSPIRPVLEAAILDCQPQAADRQIEVHLDCDDHLMATINSPLLEQAIVNLLDNAIKYSEAGSSVAIDAQASHAEVMISVRDHGCGVEQEHLPRLFERFYRVDRARSRKLGGTGLGLAIVKHIVQAHRGQITVSSTFGEGSTFTVHLPLARAAVLAEAVT
jgi:two-component system phosphate regulon sensor histidine kinase PhoR